MEEWFAGRLEPSGLRQLKVDIPFNGRNGREFSLLQLGQHPRDFQLKGKEGRKRRKRRAPCMEVRACYANSCEAGPEEHRRSEVSLSDRVSHCCESLNKAQ